MTIYSDVGEILQGTTHHWFHTGKYDRTCSFLAVLLHFFASSGQHYTPIMLKFGMEGLTVACYFRDGVQLAILLVWTGEDHCSRFSVFRLDNVACFLAFVEYTCMGHCCSSMSCDGLWFISSIDD